MLRVKFNFVLKLSLIYYSWASLKDHVQGHNTTKTPENCQCVRDANTEKSQSFVYEVLKEFCGGIARSEINNLNCYNPYVSHKRDRNKDTI
jgi:hypothetical protein